ncbi:MAG: hypothetical protein ACU0A2_15360, partial [Cognatishimia sp.]|uniref:hypothetical protein n=1 Tax=Cognatishimia sp. TaxID=2211648 RepID=UPI0040582978
EKNCIKTVKKQGEEKDQNKPDDFVKNNKLIVESLIGFGVDQLISFGVSSLQSRAEELSELSQHKYTSNVIIDEPRFFAKQDQCILLVRKIDGVATTAAVFLLHKKEANSTDRIFTLAPAFVGLKQATAITAKHKGVNLSFALAAKVASTSTKGPTVSEVALGTFTTPIKKIGNTVEPSLGNPSLGAVNIKNMKTMKLTLAVVETGSEIPDSEKAKAEIKALADALGPKIKEKIISQIGD